MNDNEQKACAKNNAKDKLCGDSVKGTLRGVKITQMKNCANEK